MVSVTFYRRPVGGSWTNAQPLDTRLVKDLAEAKEVARRFRARYATTIRYSYDGTTYYCMK